MFKIWIIGYKKMHIILGTLIFKNFSFKYLKFILRSNKIKKYS